MSLTGRPILLLMIVGVVVHAGVLVAVHHRTGHVDGNAFKSLDCGEFYQIARNVASHAAFSQSEGPPWKPDTWRTPGYPVFLALLMLLFGDSPAILVVMQQVLSILNVLLLFLIARNWMSDRRAMVAALLFLLEPYHLLYSTWLMATTLFVTVLLLTWFAWERAIDTYGRRWFALSGVLAATLVLVRPVGLLIPLVLFFGFAGAYLFCGAQGGPDKPGSATGSHGQHRQVTTRLTRDAIWAGFGMFALLFFIVVGSWMLRNKVVAGRFALSDQGGVVLA